MVNMSIGYKIFLLITSFNAIILYFHGINNPEFISFIASLLILLGISIYQYYEVKQKKKRQKRLLRENEVITLSDGPTLSELLAYLFLPDLTELSFLFIGYLIVIELLVPFMGVPLNMKSPVFYIYYGITLMFFYYMRWGYTSVNNIMKRIEKKLDELFQKNAEKKHIIELKLFGIIVSTSMTIIAYLFWFNIL